MKKALAAAAVLAVLATASIAHAGSFLAGFHSGGGQTPTQPSHRFTAKFRVTSRDVVRDFVVTHFSLECGGSTGDQGTYTYGRIKVADSDKLNSNLVFQVKDTRPSPFGDPTTLTIIARGRARIDGFRGTVRFIQNGANCARTGHWKAD